MLKDVPLFDMDVFREAIINAFLHNKWVEMNEPMVTIYSNRIEILSRGTIPQGQTVEGFLKLQRNMEKKHLNLEKILL